MIRSVTIAGIRIPVRYKDYNGELYGQYFPEEKYIELDKGLLEKPEIFRATLWHEMVEATLMITGVAWSERYEQEVVVRALENVFYPAWRKVEKRLDAARSSKKLLTTPTE